MVTADEILEHAQWDFFWAPADAVIVDRPELLYIRSSRDQTFLNTVTRTRASAERLPALLDEIDAAHRGVRSRWLVSPHSQPAGLEEALAERGYAAEGDSYGYVSPVAAYQPRSTPDLAVRRVDRRIHLDHWYYVVSTSFGVAMNLSEPALAAELQVCRDPGSRLQRFVAYDRDGAPIGAADLRLYPSLDFGYLVGGCTLPEARGRGGYSALLTARIEVARARGIGLVGLYALCGTSAPVVERQGFQRHGPARYWRRAAPERG